MTEPYEADVLRFLEMLGNHIGVNALARITIQDHANPALKQMRYHRAEAAFETDPPAPSRNRLGEIAVSAKLTDAIFQLALLHEDTVIPFMHMKLGFYDVQDDKPGNQRAFVIVFMDPHMI